MEYNLNEEELLKIKSLIKNNIKIYKLYQILYKLELEDKKNTKEYLKYIDYFNKYIEIENKLYNELDINSLLDVAKFIYNYTFRYTQDSKEAILKQEYEISVLFRILNTIIFKIIKHTIINNLSKDEITNLLTILNIKSIESTSISNQIMLNNQIETDTLYCFISFLENYITDPKFSLQKEKLISALYNTIFINKDIECYAVSTYFTFPKTPSISSKVYVDLLNINTNTYNTIKNNYSQKLANTQIYELLEIEDIDYNDKDKVSTSILRQCMLKAAFLIMNDETINNVNYDFHEYLDDKEYEDVHPYSKISESIISHLFKNIKIDKSKARTISLRS